MGDVQPTAGVGTERTARGDSETIRDVAVDLPILHVIAGKEIVERNDAIERGLGKERLEREHTAPADPEVRVVSPIELYPERRVLLGAWGSRPRGRAPLSQGERWPRGKNFRRFIPTIPRDPVRLGNQIIGIGNRPAR